MPKVYLYTTQTKKAYFSTKEYKPVKVYVFTNNAKKAYFTTKNYTPTKVYFTTPNARKAYFTSVPYKTFKAYFYTPSVFKTYFTTPELDISVYPNNCRYPEELERIRHNATLLIWDIVEDCLKSSIHKESYGKENLGGYNKAGILRLLLDYLSLIWIEKNNDSKSGLVRTSNYYYDKYSINDILISFRKCDLNIKEILALFNLNSYTVLDDGWPNYFVINNILNPPTEQDMPTLKQYTDIFTQEDVSLDSNQSVYPLDNAQINFPLTKTLKYLTNFSINGSDYIGYVDYNYTTIMYDAPQLNGYTITNSDTVTITYWYEE
jgi:hypothetical protein